jgi:hypothetical protein
VRGRSCLRVDLCAGTFKRRPRAVEGWLNRLLDRSAMPPLPTGNGGRGDGPPRTAAVAVLSFVAGMVVANWQLASSIRLEQPCPPPADPRITADAVAAAVAVVLATAPPSPPPPPKPSCPSIPPSVVCPAPLVCPPPVVCPPPPPVPPACPPPDCPAPAPGTLPAAAAAWVALPESTAGVSGAAILAANGDPATIQFIPGVPDSLRMLSHVNGRAVSPYAGFDVSLVPSRIIRWTKPGPVIDLVRQLRPAVYIEVGVWMGATVIEVAKEMEALGLTNSYVIAVDTWLGALEFMCSRRMGSIDSSRNLHPRFGYPSVFYRFLSNVVAASVARRVVPVTQTSVLAAKYFVARSIRADLIYIDGSHEYDDVMADLLLYWNVLNSTNPEATLVGDDLGWTGVRRAVDAFVAQYCDSTYATGAEKKWWLKYRQCPRVPAPPNLKEGCGNY